MKIAFLGDVVFTGKYDLNTNPKAKEFLLELKNKLVGYDYVVANLESPLTSRNFTLVCKSQHVSSNPINIELLKFIGVNAVTLANNHIFDYGKKGVSDTIEILEKNKIEWYGINGKTIKKKIKNEKISFGGYCCYSTNGVYYLDKKTSKIGLNVFSVENLKKQLINDKKEGYFSVISAHFGREYTYFPAISHAKILRYLTQFNDCVVHGHHTHVLQGAEKINKSLIAYSLGNALFSGPTMNSDEFPGVPETKESLILGVEIKNGAIEKYIFDGFIDDINGIKHFEVNDLMNDISSKLKLIDNDSFEYAKIRNDMERKKIKILFGERTLFNKFKKINYYKLGNAFLTIFRQKKYEKVIQQANEEILKDNDKNRKKKILFVNANVWKNSNSFGSTFSNIFDGIENFELAQVYCDSGLPESDICKEYFQISPVEIIKSVVTRKNVGTRVCFENENVRLHAVEKETKNGIKSIINIALKYPMETFKLVEEILWCLGCWKNERLKEFVETFQPDIIFLPPLSQKMYVNRIALYLKKVTNAKLVCYLADDIYSMKKYRFSPIFWIMHIIRRDQIRRVMKLCDRYFVISKEQIPEGEKNFQITGNVLTKCMAENIEYAAPKIPTDVIKMVYTGNLGDGRWRTISNILNAIKDINKNGKKITFDIYSGTKLTKKQIKSISDDENSFYKGEVSAEKIPEIQSNADVLLHVEGFALKNRCSVRHSFSTKLIDYFSKSRSILAVGPSDIASISYLIHNDAAIVATNKKEILNVLKGIVENPAILQEYAKKGYDCGFQNHSKTYIQNKLINSIESLFE